MDVGTPFLNGDLEKEISMLQLEGCIVLVKIMKFLSWKSFYMA